MKGGRICGEDCVHGIETGWKFDQSSPSTFTLPQSNDYTNATELWIKVTADGVFVAPAGVSDLTIFAKVHICVVFVQGDVKSAYSSLSSTLYYFLTLYYL